MPIQPEATVRPHPRFLLGHLLHRVTTLIIVVANLSHCICHVFADNLGEIPCRPNIVLILADDFGYECIGANDGTSYRTPNLDRLAAEGARFEHCYVQPLCTPTRVQLMTGKYNVRNYVQFGTLDRAQTTFGHLFQKAGYATCIVGKWQLGQQFELPKHFGFDEYCLWQLTRIPERYRNPGIEINGKEIDYKNGEYGPDIVNDYACEFVARSKNKPFLLYYPMMLTHSPYVATPDSDDYGTPQGLDQKKMTKDASGSSKNQHFGDMVEYMDKLIGKLVTRLEAEGIRERTLIVFTGDNGTGKGIPSRMGDRTVIGGKGTADESGMRVALIANGPQVKGGTVCRDLVDSSDFLPTICSAAGITPPTDLTLDGSSFWPQCRGESGTPREWIYCWYARGGGPKADAEFARSHEFKLYRDGRLFDVRQGDFDKQPLETASLDAAGKKSVAKLQATLDLYRDARPAGLRKPALPRVGKGKATE